MKVGLLESFDRNLFLDLRKREWEVLVLLAESYTNAEIMDIFSLRRRTVINIRNSIGEKLDIKGVHLLASFARREKNMISQLCVKYVASGGKLEKKVMDIVLQSA